MASVRFAVFGLVMGAGVALGAGESGATVYCTAPNVPAGCVWNPGGVGVLPGPGAGAAGPGLTRGPGVGQNGVGVYPGAGAGAAGVGIAPGAGVGAPGVGAPGYGGANAGGPVNRAGVR
jgi:hypothetical protein